VKRPRIGIPTPNSNTEYSLRVLPQYAAAVEAAGGEPVEIPINAMPEEIAQKLKSCDGVLLPGSPADVDPEKYGAARDPKTSEPDPARDDADELVLQDAHNMRKPILAICYGLQSLNVWRTGSLVQHLETRVPHSRPDGMPKTDWPTHAAIVETGSRLSQIVHSAMGDHVNEIIVNSSHHQCIDVPGDGLRIVARSPQDGVVEAIESTAEDHFVVGVQWHPERMWQGDSVSREIFRGLVEEARKWHEQRVALGRDFETLNR
jgi:putative glutamine amidotransferase